MVCMYRTCQPPQALSLQPSTQGRINQHHSLMRPSTGHHHHITSHHDLSPSTAEITSPNPTCDRATLVMAMAARDHRRGPSIHHASQGWCSAFLLLRQEAEASSQELAVQYTSRPRFIPSICLWPRWRRPQLRHGNVRSIRPFISIHTCNINGI